MNLENSVRALIDQHLAKAQSLESAATYAFAGRMKEDAQRDAELHRDFAKELQGILTP